MLGAQSKENIKGTKKRQHHLSFHSLEPLFFLYNLKFPSYQRNSVSKNHSSKQTTYKINKNILNSKNVKIKGKNNHIHKCFSGPVFSGL